MKLLGLVAPLCCGFIVVSLILRRDPEKRCWEYFPDMARSVAYKSQSSNPFLANQQTDQKPVQGTLARGFEPFHYTTAVRDFVRAGDELKSPFNEQNPPDLARGKKIF